MLASEINVNRDLSPNLIFANQEGRPHHQINLSSIKSAIWYKIFGNKGMARKKFLDSYTTISTLYGPFPHWITIIHVYIQTFGVIGASAQLELLY